MIIGIILITTVVVIFIDVNKLENSRQHQLYNVIYHYFILTIDV